MRAKKLDRDVDKTLMQKSDDHTRPTRHRGVDRVACKEIAKERIFAIRRPASHLITRIEITKNNWNVFALKIRFDALA
jgi:hypothetical protein